MNRFGFFAAYRRKLVRFGLLGSAISSYGIGDRSHRCGIARIGHFTPPGVCNALVGPPPSAARISSALEIWLVMLNS